MQQDGKVFWKYVDEIRELGVDVILKKGRVSRTTLYTYMRQVPVNQSTEDAIIQSVIECRADRAEERKKRQESARQAINA